MTRQEWLIYEKEQERIREEKIKGKTDWEIKKMDCTEKAFRLNSEAGNIEHFQHKLKDIEYNCETCRNKGIVYVAEIEEDIQRAEVKRYLCDCVKKRETLLRIKQSGMEEQLKRKTLSNFIAETKTQKLLKLKALKYLNSTDWAVFSGQVGSGKTHICTAIIGELIKSGKSCLYKNYVHHIEALKRNLYNGEYDTAINELKKCEVLYIDDLFKSSTATKTDIRIIYEVIDYRYINNLKTIISCESGFEWLMAIDEGVASRILEKAGDNWINIPQNNKDNYRLRRVDYENKNNV